MDKRLKRYLMIMLLILFVSSLVMSYFILVHGPFGSYFYLILSGSLLSLLLLVYVIVEGNVNKLYNILKGIDSNKVLAIVAILTLIASVIASTNSINLSKKIIDMTPSKYAYIDSMTTDFINQNFYVSLENVNNKKGLEIGFNMINTGQLNSGKIQITTREIYNSDYNFTLQPIDILDIDSKSNKAFKLNFSITKPLTSFGNHQINLSIFCMNCYEQGILNTKTIFICIYNNSYKDCN